MTWLQIDVSNSEQCFVPDEDLCGQNIVPLQLLHKFAA